MSKIVFVNLDVSSAIEQSGNNFINWLKEIESDIKIFTEQTQEEDFFNCLLKEKPELVIINGEYNRIYTPMYFYKLCFPKVKFILLMRCFTSFLPLYEYDDNEYEQHYRFRSKKLFDHSNIIFMDNSCKIKQRIPVSLKNKIVDCCGFNDIDDFKIIIPWEERKKKFLIFGSLYPHKLSEEFLEKIQKTDIKIDAYGYIKHQSEDYAKLFNECKNINYKGEVKFEDVPSLLNQYKYYLLPHNGAEPLNYSLIQNILCGTIPLILDDNTPVYNRYWLEWAKEMYFGTDNIDIYIDNIQKLFNDDLEKGQEISETFRQIIIEKYYNKEDNPKYYFLKYVKELLEEKI